MYRDKNAQAGKKLRNPNKPLKIAKEWTFKSSEVAAKFEQHVKESLPWYELATGIVAHIVRAYVPVGGRIVDVGCSTGNIGRAIASTIGARRASLAAIDDSEAMGAVYDAPGRFICADAAEFDFAAEEPDLIVCFLALMFVPTRARGALLARMKQSLRPGGALIVFDKMIPQPGYRGTVAYRLTLAAKRDAGVSAEDVIAKELSISGIQRPMEPQELAGFAEIFRFGDFAGFVWEKPI